jgi:hypothetical protein
MPDLNDAKVTLARWWNALSDEVAGLCSVLQICSNWPFMKYISYSLRFTVFT